MSITSTTLAAAITATQTEFKVTSSTGFVVGYLLKIDSEFMIVKAVDTSTHWITVYERGYKGTKGVDHNILAPCDVGTPEDFPPEVPWHVYTYGANGAITVGPGVHRIAKGSAAALTLRAPRIDEDGLKMTFVITTGYLHSITLDSGYFNGSTDTQILFVATAGKSVTLLANRGNWIIVSSDATSAFNLPSRSASVSPSASASKSASVSASKSPSVSPSVSESVSPSAS